MDLFLLNALFRYCPKTGRLYRGRSVVKGTPTYPGSKTLVVGVKGKMETYARVCFLMHFGYLPKTVRHRDLNASNNCPDNLYDPARDPKKAPAKAEKVTHAGKYPGVCVMRCQRTAKHRGYQGSVYHGGKRHRTPVVETAEMARDLLLLLTAQVEWLAQQKENAQ